LVIKGGIYEGKAVTSEEVMQLANLESREVLLAKLAGAMKGSIAKAARVFDALRIKLEAGSPSTPSAPAAPVAEAVAVVEEASPVVEEASPVVEEAASPEPVIENNKEEA
jgi:large subunit ribosomal protein L10